MLRNGISGDWIGTWSGHKGAVWSAKLDPSGYLCATASGDFSVKVWDGVTGKELYTYPHKHIVKTVDFSPDSKKLASGGHEGLLRVYELGKGEKAVPVVIRQNESEKVNITKCQWYNNKIVLVASSDGSIKAWDIESKTVLCALQVDAEVRDMEFSRNIQGKDILIVAAGSKVSLFHLVGSEDGSTFNGFLMHGHKMPIHFKEEGGASLHPSGQKFVAGGSDLWVRVFDTATGEELECHRGHHGPIRCLRYAPNGETYATGSEDGTIRLWKTNP